MTSGYAGTYTFAWILRNQRAELWESYDPIWFQQRVEEAGIEGLREVLYAQPPASSFILWPFTGLPPENARLLWIALSLFFFFSQAA